MRGRADYVATAADCIRPALRRGLAIEARTGENPFRLGVIGSTDSHIGLAAIWAADNTRSAILDAFKRREVYATTGPRIRVQIFAGSDFIEADLESAAFAQRGYERGVPMGGRPLAGCRG